MERLNRTLLLFLALYLLVAALAFLPAGGSTAATPGPTPTPAETDTLSGEESFMLLDRTGSSGLLC